jgi:CP family cyanate transporter-like MFS transporter
MDPPYQIKRPKSEPDGPRLATDARLLVLGLALPPLLARPPDVGRPSAAMFVVSYAFAMLVSVICGLANDLTGDARSALAFIAASILPLVLLPPTTRFQRG